MHALKTAPPSSYGWRNCKQPVKSVIILTTVLQSMERITPRTPSTLTQYKKSPRRSFHAKKSKISPPTKYTNIVFPDKATSKAHPTLLLKLWRAEINVINLKHRLLNAWSSGM